MDEPEDWIRSTFCGGGACVEALLGATVRVRDSRRTVEVVVERGHWRDFVAGVKAGVFDG